MLGLSVIGICLVTLLHATQAIGKLSRSILITLVKNIDLTGQSWQNRTSLINFRQNVCDILCVFMNFSDLTHSVTENTKIIFIHFIHMF